MVGGEMEPEEFLKSYISPDDYLICADRGADWAYRLGFRPSAVVGDFDSVSDEAKEFFRDGGCLFIPYPAEKDQTDTEIAIDHALEMGAREIVLTCALGGRVDHEIGNVYLLEKLAKRGVKSKIVSKMQTVSLIDGSAEFRMSEGRTLSLFSLTDEAIGITTEGLKYPLRNGRLVRGTSLGISNELAADRAYVELKSGRLLAVQVRT
jgi:thiamine pyrophosphokinase